MIRPSCSATIAVLLLALAVRLPAAPGDIDLNFGVGTAANASIFAIDTQADGKILVGGTFDKWNDQTALKIVRLFEDGSTDTSFQGFLGDSICYAVDVAPDGKLYICGTFTSISGGLRNRIARLNADGTLDTTFTPGAGPDGRVDEIAIQADGKVVIAGTFENIAGVARRNLARLNTNGTLDTTFDIGTGPDSPTIYHIDIQNDGKILIGGSFFTFNGRTIRGVNRLNADGSNDGTFAPGTGAGGLVNQIQDQPDGKILVAGGFNVFNEQPRSKITRLNADGSFDPAYSAATSINSDIRAFEVLPDGRILIGGVFSIIDAQAFNSVARLDTNGTLDTSFNAGTGASHAINTIRLDRQQKLIVAGEFTTFAGTPANRIIRLGTADPLPPMITNHPASIFTVAGSNGAFNVGVKGDPPFTYQWFFQSNAIPGQTNAQLTLTNIQAADVGCYHVVVNNVVGSDTSSNACLTLGTAPAFNSHPVSQVVNQGAGTSFSASATGTTPLSYQWLFNGAPVTDQTNTTIFINNAQPADEGTYALRVSNLFGTLTSSNATLTVLRPPVIQTNGHPQSLTILEGQNASFSVSADGTPPFTYQWFFNGGAINDATNATLSLTNVPFAQGGPYFATVANALGTAISSNATLTVLVPPAIVVQPVSQTIVAGNAAVLTASATGQAPLFYQWRVNGQDISGANSTSLILFNVQPANAGLYSVHVTNSVGAATSTNATVTVKIPPAITGQPQPQTVLKGATAVFSVGVSGDGPCLYQWRKDGVALSGATNLVLALTNAQPSDQAGYSVIITCPFGTAISRSAALTVNCPPEITLHPVSQTVAQGANVTLTAAATGTPVLAYQWLFNGAGLAGANNATLVLPGVRTNQAGLYSLLVTNAFGAAITTNAVLTVLNPPMILTQPQPLTVRKGDPATFSVTATGDEPCTYQWRFEGTNLAGANAATLTLTNAQLSQTGDYSVVIACPGGTVTSVNAALTVIDPPVIVSNPVSLDLIQGSNATFSVTASGAPPLIYQWRKGGANLPGANAAVLVLNNVMAAQAGAYSVVVTNAFGTATSTDATLTVRIPPAIVTPPDSRTVTKGGNTTFTVTATGDAPLAYQWRFNGVNLAGASGTSLTLTNAQPAQGGNYSVRVSNPYGAVTSVNAALTVADPPVITFQPVSQVVFAGTNAHVSVLAAGGKPLSYQWRFNGVNLSATTNASATRATLVVPAIQLEQDGTYSVVVANQFGTVTSVDAAITVISPPDIRRQPASAGVRLGTNVTFSVEAVGTAPLTYQWHFNGAPIPGATGASVTLAGVRADQIGSYTVTLSNPLGIVVGGPATLSLNVPQVLQPPVRLDDGRIQFTFGDFDGVPSAATNLAVAVVQGSSNFVNWVTLTSGIVLTNGVIQVTDNPAAATGLRFYRVLVP